MLGIALKILQLIWPYVKETLLTSPGDPAQGKNKEMNIMFIMFILMFAVLLYQTEHGLSRHKYYMEQISDANLSLERARSVNQIAEMVRQENLSLRAVNRKNQNEIALLNRLVQRAFDELPLDKAESLLNRELTYARNTETRDKIRQKLDELSTKYPGAPQK